MAPSDGNGPQFVLLLLAAILPISALIGYRMPLGKMVRTALVWAAIFALVAAVFAYKPQLERGFRGFTDGFSGPKSAGPDEQSVRIEKSDDGHYWIDVEINRQTVRMMVDSGATLTAMSDEAADALGLTSNSALDVPYVVETANGMVKASRRTIPKLAVEGFELADVSVSVSPQFGSTRVLGMNFLDRLESWQVVDGQLILVFPQSQQNEP